MTAMIHRRDLRATLGVCGKTLTKYIRNKVVPPPDLQVSSKDQWWWPSTLEAAGLASPQTPATSGAAQVETQT